MNKHLIQIRKTLTQYQVTMNNEVEQALRLIETDYYSVAHYYDEIDSIDPSHGWEHIISVVAGSIKYCQLWEGNIAVAAIAALWHDVASLHDRENHEIVGGELFLSQSHLVMVTPFSTWIKVPRTIQTHRKSKLPHPETKEELAVALADKGMPAQTLDELLARAIQYNVFKQELEEPTVNTYLTAVLHVLVDIEPKVYSEEKVWTLYRDTDLFAKRTEIINSLPTLELVRKELENPANKEVNLSEFKSLTEVNEYVKALAA